MARIPIWASKEGDCELCPAESVPVVAFNGPYGSVMACRNCYTAGGIQLEIEENKRAGAGTPLTPWSLLNTLGHFGAPWDTF